jgi:serine/threonine protein kinase
MHCTVPIIRRSCAAMHAGTKIAISESIRYSPPEAIAAADRGHTTVPSDPAADIWAFGAITYELTTGKSMVSGYRTAEEVRSALRGQTPFPWEVSVGVNANGCFSKIGGLRRVLKWCLCRDPAQRPTAHALVAEITSRMRAAETSSSQFKNSKKK